MRVIGLLIFLLAGPASACWIAPEHLSATHDELIARTSTIALADVVRAEVSGQHVAYVLRTVRAVKGRPPSSFELLADASLYPAQDNDFDRHSSKDFWSLNIGRATMHSDCEVHPSFSIGGTYLVFLDQPFHAKSFELIRVTDGERQDQWLKYVLDRVEP